jgi:hypothetical protein
VAHGDAVFPDIDLRLVAGRAENRGVLGEDAKEAACEPRKLGETRMKHILNTY